MLLRKLAASILVFLFVVLAIPNFFIYSLSRTYLNTDFYKRDDLTNGVYEVVVDKTTEGLQSKSTALNGFFKSDELKKQIKQVFTAKIFSEIVADFANQMELYKQNPNKPLVLSLKLLRENLLTVSNNLAYIIYQDLPTCSDAELADLKPDVIPSCVPKGVDYDQVVKPIINNFEASVYEAVPEELSNIDKAFPIQVLVDIENYRTISFMVLILLICLISLVLYKPISLIVTYLGTAIFLGGAAGLGISYTLENLLSYVNVQTNDQQMVDLIHFFLNFLAAEMNRLAWLFIAAGVALYVIRFILVRTVDENVRKNEQLSAVN